MAETSGHGRTAKKKAVLEALKAGNTRRASALAAGISERTFYVWLENDCAFLQAVEKAEAEAELEAVEEIRKAGRESWQANAWWLERRRHEDWRRRDEINVGKLTIPQLLAIATAGDPGAESAGDRMATADLEDPAE